MTITPEEDTVMEKLKVTEVMLSITRFGSDLFFNFLRNAHPATWSPESEWAWNVQDQIDRIHVEWSILPEWQYVKFRQYCDHTFFNRTVFPVFPDQQGSIWILMTDDQFTWWSKSLNLDEVDWLLTFYSDINYGVELLLLYDPLTDEDDSQRWINVGGLNRK